MLVFNEGLPRAGKSYDAVKSHILPALKAGRRVYARLNGLSHEKIAAYLALDLERVRELLVLVPTKDVRERFRAVNDAEGGWCIPDELKNALFVVDEAHEFYVADRAPIEPALEQFFALHGQNGMDGLLLSQYYRRLHSSVRCRVERKNVFQKLSAVAMDKSYLVSRYHATGPDQYELVGSDTCKYDPAMFPLYKGYADGASNTDVYKAGAKTVWHKLGKYALFMVPLVLLGVWFFARFFTGAGGMVKHPAAQVSGPVHSFTRVTSGVSSQVLPAVGMGSSLQPRVSDADLKKMPQSAAYVFRLCDQARPRLAAIGKGPAGEFGVIEWPQSNGTDVLDRLSFAQLRAMAVGVEVHSYGVRLWYRDTSLVVTAWPLATPQDQPSATSSSQPVQTAAAAPVQGIGGPYPRQTARPYDPTVFAPQSGTQSLGQYGSADSSQ